MDQGSRSEDKSRAAGNTRRDTGTGRVDFKRVHVAPLAWLRRTASGVVEWLATPWVRPNRASSDEPAPRAHRYPPSWHESGLVYDELRRTVDYQVVWQRDIDDKATRTIRFNALVLGVVVPVFSFAVRFGPVGSVEALYNLHVAAGLVALLASAALAGVTYTGSDLDVGISPRDVEVLRRRALADREVHDALVESYARWIRSNRRTLFVNSTSASVTMLLTVSALVLLALGMLQAATDGVSVLVRVGTYLALGAVALGTGVL